jgi:hypothetical protein
MSINTKTRSSCARTERLCHRSRNGAGRRGAVGCTFVAADVACTLSGPSLSAVIGSTVLIADVIRYRLPLSREPFVAFLQQQADREIVGSKMLTAVGDLLADVSVGCRGKYGR